MHSEAVFAHNFVDTQVLADWLMRHGAYVADHGIAGEGDYRAARDLLMAVAPRLRGQELQVDGEASLAARNLPWPRLAESSSARCLSQPIGSLRRKRFSVVL